MTLEKLLKKRANALRSHLTRRFRDWTFTDVVFETTDNGPHLSLQLSFDCSGQSHSPRDGAGQGRGHGGYRRCHGGWVSAWALETE
jgi:hypothetical protein